MPRTPVSTTVDETLLVDARQLYAGATDAEMIDAALSALLRHHRSGEINAAYSAAYGDHPIDEPDLWGDLDSFRSAAGRS